MNSGAEAVEASVKLARKTSGRQGVIEILHFDAVGFNVCALDPHQFQADFLD